ncbi:MAG: DUF4198 domain-containing protein [Planctomycetota bacterium]|nr:MAG: DUF4198 domain-containing protein [Planctomycetota bacterium]
MARMNRAAVAAAVAIPALSAVASARAGDPLADQLQVQTGGSVTVHLRDPLAEPGGSMWTADQIEWLFIRGDGVQRNVPPAAFHQPDATSLSIRLKRPGVTMIGVDRRPQVRQWPARRVREALAGLVDEAALPAADAAPQRVRLVESSKIIVTVAGESPRPGEQSAVAQSKSGQRVEIRLLADPARTPVGSDLPVRVYVDGAKRSGASVVAEHVASGATSAAFTTRDGFANFTMTERGRWRITALAADVSRFDDVDWVVFAAQIEFEVDAAEAGP